MESLDIAPSVGRAASSGRPGANPRPFLKAADIHARIQSQWPAILALLGVPHNFLLLKKPGPCLFCGGKDRWVFDNRSGRGDYFCRRCGSGDGFNLLIKFTGENFATVRKRVMEVAGLTGERTHPVQHVAPATRETGQPAKPSPCALALMHTSCTVDDCQDARTYFNIRGLWPLPAKCTVRAHLSVEYWEDGRRTGRHAALVAPVRDINGEFVTAHVTFLKDGWKLRGQEPRKLISKLTGRQGCSVRLVPIDGEVLGIAEGIETALSAAKMHRMPTWAAINAPLLGKFIPPEGVRHLVVFADRDVAGLEAARKLMERLQGRVHVEVQLPSAPHKDWNDVTLETLA